MQSQSGMTLSVLNYGCRITRLTLPGPDATQTNIVASLSLPDDYLTETDYLGGVVGRYANRIECGCFTLDNAPVQLTVNEGRNHLHGGDRGFDRRIWQVDSLFYQELSGFEFSRVSPHGEEGYPGNLTVKVRYLLPHHSLALIVEIEATTDAPTVVSLAQHSYFNLSGDFNRRIAGYQLQLYADDYLAVNDEMIPVNIESVAGTDMDFRESKVLKQAMDHCFLIEGPVGKLRRAARVYDPDSCRGIEVWTTEPGIQVYTGNHLDGSTILTGGQSLNYQGAICLETQRLPDAPNRPEFGLCVLRPGETYRSKTIYRFTNNTR